MNELQLIKSANFGNTQCDIYTDGKDGLYVTREQVGRALEYSDPIRAVSKMHDRKKERLDKYSVVVKLTGTDGKVYNTTVYNRKGIMEICRHSNQPKADAFMDWAWDIMDSLISGKAKVVSMTEYQKMMTQTRFENARIRKARELTRLAEKYKGQTYAQILDSYATVELTGEHLIPLPSSERKTYTATEIGEMAGGISANKVGALTNKHNLKTDEYGQWCNDKSRYSSKEVRSFRYYENVIPEIRKYL